ncbi:MAG: beta strand repeat-containing protein, partial [Planctomycetota bacterium]
MERARKISRKYYLRQIMACWLSCWMLFGIPVQVVMANPNPVPNTAPSSTNVISNTVPLNWTGDGGLNPSIDTAAGNNIIGWNNFDIGSNGSVTFTQNGGWILNNVQDVMATGINGELIGPDCGLIVVNPLGVVFGPSSLVDAQNFIASSLSISNGNFNAGNFSFTGGATAGDIINRSENGIIAQEMVALIGRNVTNRGFIAGEYVIMAAGDNVLITQNSPVVVEVAMANPADHMVDQGGSLGTGNGEVEADHLILAAGDVWSTGIDGVETLRAEAKRNAVFRDSIYAYDEEDSDAVADVTIITGGDFTVDDEIKAEAEADGAGTAVNAIAGVTIDAGGTVNINDTVQAEADAEDESGNATATVTIKAGEGVNINYIDEEYGVDADAWADGDSGNATAKVDISAGGTVNIFDASTGRPAVRADADSRDGSGDAKADVIITGESVYNADDIKANAKVDSAKENSGDATATVKITADGASTVVIDDPINAEARTTNGSGDAKAKVDIDASGNVSVDNDFGAEADAEDDSGDATATVDITSGGAVHVDNGIDAEADTRRGSDNATASINITAEGLVTVDSSPDASANAEDDSGDAKADVDITSNGGSVIIDTDDGINAFAAARNGSGDADAGIDISAAEGVNISTGSDTVEADAETYESGDATADLDITAGGSVNITGDVMANADADDSGSADATLDIVAGGNVYIHEYEDSVTAWADVYSPDEDEDLEDAKASLSITAGGSVNLHDSVRATARAERGAGDADATVTINATDVIVTDESEVKASGTARYGSGDATAKVDVTTTNSNVLVEQGSTIGAYGYTGHGSGDAKADITVDTGYVTVTTDSEIWAEAYTEHGSGDAEAGTVIIADDDVLVEDDSYVVAWAETYHYHSGDATASVDIDAGGDVTVSGEDGSSKIMAHAMTDWPKCEVFSSGSATATVDIDAGGNVTATKGSKIAAVAVVLDGGGQQQAGAQQEQDPGVALLEYRDATAEVTINAGGDVTVEKGGEITATAKNEGGLMGGNALALEEEENGEDTTFTFPGDATASVDIVVGGDVTVEKGGEIKAEADIYVNVELPEMGPLDNGDDIYPEGLGDATASVDIDAGGNVTVDKGGEIKAEATIENDIDVIQVILESADLPDFGDATASVDIVAGGDVTVSKGGEIGADAGIYYRTGLVDQGMAALENGDNYIPDLGDATATVDIDAEGFLTVEGEDHKDGEIYAEASIMYDVGIDWQSEGEPVEIDWGWPTPVPVVPGYEGTGDATASITINAREGVLVDIGGEIVADAYIAPDIFGGFSAEEIGPEFFALHILPGNASASVDIETCGDVIVNDQVGAYANIHGFKMYPPLIRPAEVLEEPSPPYVTDADVKVKAFGDIIINQHPEPEEPPVDEFTTQGGSSWSSGRIEAIADGGDENNADVILLACSDVIVSEPFFDIFAGDIETEGLFGSDEEILAKAGGGFLMDDAYENNAHIGIATRDGDITVGGQIKAYSKDGQQNNAAVEISAARDLTVKGVSEEIEVVVGFGGPKGGVIEAEADDGEYNNAFVGIVAGRDVIVEGKHTTYYYYEPGDSIPDGWGSSPQGGQILATADGPEGWFTSQASENTAEIEIWAGRDVVVEGEHEVYEPMDEVIPTGGGSTGGRIIAEAGKSKDSDNTAFVGVYAGRDVIVEGKTVTEPIETLGNGDDVGLIRAKARGDDSTNNADVVICAGGDVTVDGLIEAETEEGGKDTTDVGTASIIISAGDEISGTGTARALGDEYSITFGITDLSLLDFSEMFLDPEEPDVVVGSVDCPDCDFDWEWIDWTWCEDCEELPLAPAAPLGELIIPMVLGCPAEMDAAAGELGIAPEQLQVAMAGALAQNPSMQPCEACRTLISSAAIL